MFSILIMRHVKRGVSGIVPTLGLRLDDGLDIFGVIIHDFTNALIELAVVSGGPRNSRRGLSSSGGDRDDLVKLFFRRGDRDRALVDNILDHRLPFVTCAIMCVGLIVNIKRSGLSLGFSQNTTLKNRLYSVITTTPLNCFKNFRLETLLYQQGNSNV
jgi:hypothetical protein